MLRILGYSNAGLVIFMMMVESSDVLLISEFSLIIQMHSYEALDNATYSASAVDKATVSCILLFHNTGPPPMQKTQVRVKKFVPNKKGDIGMEVYPTPMSLLVNLGSSSDGNDIGVGLT